MSGEEGEKMRTKSGKEQGSLYCGYLHYMSVDMVLLYQIDDVFQPLLLFIFKFLHEVDVKF